MHFLSAPSSISVEKFIDLGDKKEACIAWVQGVFLSCYQLKHGRLYQGIEPKKSVKPEGTPFL